VGGCGVIFKVARDTSGVWTESNICTISGGADGEHPFSALTVDAPGGLVRGEQDLLAFDHRVFQKFLVVVVGIVDAVMGSAAFFPRQRRA
jgi:hypothetical protein